MKRIILVVLAVAMVLGTTACGLSKNKVASSNNQQKGTVAESEVTTEAPTEESVSTVGGYIQGKNLKITLEYAKQYDEIQDPDNDFLKATPSEGKKYLVLFLEFENVSSDNQYVNMFYQKAYRDDYDIDQTTLFVEPDGYSMLGGDLAAGKKLKGYACYEVNPDWQKLEYTYKDGVSSKSETFDFVVTPDKLS